MDEKKYYDMLNRIKTLEDKLQEQQKSTSASSDVIDEIQSVLNEMKVDDKESEGKIKMFEYQLEELKKGIDKVDSSIDKNDERKKDLFERTALVLLGSIVTFLFGLLKS